MGYTNMFLLTLLKFSLLKCLERLWHPACQEHGAATMLQSQSKGALCDWLYLLLWHGEMGVNDLSLSLSSFLTALNWLSTGGTLQCHMSPQQAPMTSTELKLADGRHASR